MGLTVLVGFTKSEADELGDKNVYLRYIRDDSGRANKVFSTYLDRITTVIFAVDVSKEHRTTVLLQLLRKDIIKHIDFYTEGQIPIYIDMVSEFMNNGEAFDLHRVNPQEVLNKMR